MPGCILVQSGSFVHIGQQGSAGSVLQRCKGRRGVGLHSLEIFGQLCKHLIEYGQLAGVYPLIGAARHIGHHGPYRTARSRPASVSR